MKKTAHKDEKKEIPIVTGKPLGRTHEQLKESAYYRWLERGSPEGDGLEDWYGVENKWRDNIVPVRND
jgi:hypothetical protein